MRIGLQTGVHADPQPAMYTAARAVGHTCVGLQLSLHWHLHKIAAVAQAA